MKDSLSISFKTLYSENYLQTTMSLFEPIFKTHPFQKSFSWEFPGGQDSATFTAEGPGSIPGRGTKILRAARCGQKLFKNLKEKKRQPFLINLAHSRPFFILLAPWR